MKQLSIQLASTCILGISKEITSMSYLHTTPPEHPILWIDGVGGYTMLEKDDLLIGQAGAGSRVHVGIVGDLSRQAAIIKRQQSDYLLEPIQETLLDDQTIKESSLLRSGAVVRWGERIQMRFIKPHPLSATARLEMISYHRFQPRVDGVLLMADSCILGPSQSSHVICPEWSHDLLIYKTSDQWFIRTEVPLEIDGHSPTGPIPFARGTRLRGDGWSLSIE
jgi:hypothetical protein